MKKNIRQAVFHLENKRSYKLDVNQDITIKALKKAIISAANISKSNLQIFHNGLDYTDGDEITLNEITDDLVVEFMIYIAQSRIDDSVNKIKLQLGDYCFQHEGKYLYFYCYSCKKSICSICMQSNEHHNHDLIEKYDYLQSSRHLVDLKFKEVKDLMALKLENKNDIEGFKKKIKVNYFGNLYELLRLIENKFIDLVDNYNETIIGSIKNFELNFNNVKEYCSIGLEELKEIIHVDKILANEKIFLTFDKKYRDLDNEKKKLISNYKMIQTNQTTFSNLFDLVEKVYKEINLLFDDILKKDYSIMIKSVEKSNKDEIISKILSDVKLEKPSRPNSLINKSILDNSFISKRDEEKDKENKHSRLTIPDLSPIKKNYDLMSNKSFKRDYIHKPTRVLRCIPKTKEIMIYDNETSDIYNKIISFPLLGIDKFLENCAFCNYDHKLYVSGGINNNISSNSFICYDNERNSVIRMADMLTPRHSHSMIYHNDIIYIVGGNSNSTEKYDIRTQKWIKLNNFQYDDLFYPVLYVYGNYLYSFFGIRKEIYNDLVWRINIKSLKSKWESVVYKNNDKLDLKLYGCGIIPNGTESILLIGGKNKDKIKSETFIFEFSTNSFINNLIKLEKEAFFRESVLIELEKDCYGHFDEENGDHFLRLLNSN